MKKTYIYVAIAVAVIAIIAILIVPQITGRKEPVSQGLPTEEEMQAIEVSGDLQNEGTELNSIELRDIDTSLIDAQIEEL